MTEATLQYFRDLAARMSGPEPKTWEWTGQFISQHMVNITEARAKDYAKTFGGEAREMESTESILARLAMRATAPTCATT
jgi:hypothetical protein